MVKYRAVSFKKDQIVALYFTMSDIVHTLESKYEIWGNLLSKPCCRPCCANLSKSKQSKHVFIFDLSCECRAKFLAKK